MTKLADLKKRLGADPEFKAEYEKADVEYALIESMIRARTAAKLTQAELAKKLGTTQSAIARLEGGRTSPSISTLKRYAEATGARLQVGLVRAR
ncbi:helix-turn-helix domain-containing protein [Xanthobacter agilis]|uniref:DNA-binding XRE family transcriptional regulator n=1 Tax=Xanthobacter agilis TaxID=47492 RepID=A0ABU0LH15_XANAG|nr:helix-turn-helix transcriptional regulator [Xanthobacter agilis]MDQ0506420.1 DNA-binding XRE family transcriptional regulator [Xanthobacter agilis]